MKSKISGTKLSLKSVSITMKNDQNESSDNSTAWELEHSTKGELSRYHRMRAQNIPQN